VVDWPTGRKLAGTVVSHNKWLPLEDGSIAQFDGQTRDEFVSMVNPLGAVISIATKGFENVFVTVNVNNVGTFGLTKEGETETETGSGSSANAKLGATRELPMRATAIIAGKVASTERLERTKFDEIMAIKN